MYIYLDTLRIWFQRVSTLITFSYLGEFLKNIYEEMTYFPIMTSCVNK